MFAQAELFTSISKNDLETKGAVEFNGFVIARKGVAIKSMKLDDREDTVKTKDDPKDASSLQTLNLTLRDSTARKLKDCITEFKERPSWSAMTRLVGYLTWFSTYNQWLQAPLRAIRVASTKMLYTHLSYQGGWRQLVKQVLLDQNKVGRLKRTSKYESNDTRFVAEFENAVSGLSEA